MKKDLDYQYSAYHLALNLNRRTCTYCNRVYTTTMTKYKGGKLMRPQFDHWYYKAKYPLLALSFYNLIPSCNTCNSSSKGSSEFNLEVNIHPYVDLNQTNEFSFNYIHFASKDRYKVFIKKTNDSTNKALQTLSTLGIDTMYNAHIEELKDLIKIRNSYTDKYIENLQKFFPKNSLKKGEIFRLLFGTEMDVSDFHKRPFSKFKHDILKQLKII